MFRSPRALAALASYAAVYAGALAWLARSPRFEAGESLGALLIFGLGFGALAWATTRGMTAPHVPVRAPALESAIVVAYLAAFAVLFLGWGLSALATATPPGRVHESVVLVAKLATMVVLPALVFRALGYRFRDLLGSRSFAAGHWRTFVVLAVALLALQLLVGRGGEAIAALPQSPLAIAAFAPLAFAWMALEAGLTEEFLFRALLQTRLEAWLGSRVAALVGMSLVFALAHAPGYVLRGAYAMEGIAGPPDALTAAAYSIAVVSPIGLLFGIVWLRTRSLPLVVLLHGWTDLVPNLAPFVRTWSGAAQ